MINLKQIYKNLVRKIKSPYTKKKLYTIIFESDTKLGKRFDVVLIGFIVFSIFLTIFEGSEFIDGTIVEKYAMLLEWITTLFFTIEYMLRVYCSPVRRDYVLSFFGIIDLLATLPLYLMYFLPGAQYFMILRTFRLIRVFRVFKLFNFIAEGQFLIQSILASWKKIFVFFCFVLILTICIGTIMFMIEANEPNTQFTSVSEGIYWAIVTLTTVGYGDITPSTAIGQFLSSLVMLLGYTIIAVPTGIVSASMMKNSRKNAKKMCPNCFQFYHEEDAKFCKNCGAELIVREQKNEEKTSKNNQ